VRSWTHLERQRGGFGFLGGPGETQLETDRRLIGERIVRLRAPEKTKQTQIIPGGPADAAKELVRRLREEARAIE